MEVTFLYKNLSKEEEGQFYDYIGSKLETIQQLLTKFADDGKLLKVSIEKFNKHDAYEVEFQLNLLTKSLVSKEASHQITKAVDLTKDRMLSQLKKHLAQLRNSRSHQSIRKPEAQMVAEPVHSES